MAVNATFKADFSSFYDAVQKADASLKVFDGDVMKVEKSLNRMIDDFSGQKLANDAALMTRAIGELGGASTLTEKEMARVNSTLSEAIAKYDALGTKAPADMLALAEATKGAGNEMQTFIKGFDLQAALSDPIGTGKEAMTAFASTLGPTATAALATASAVAAVGAAAFKLASEAAAAGAELDSMNAKTGLSVPTLSKLRDASAIAGTSLGEMSNVVFAFEQRMDEGGKAFKDGMDKIGLSVETIKAAGPDKYFELIVGGLQGIAEPSERAAAGTALLGKGYREVAGSLNDLAHGFELAKDIEPWTAAQAKEAAEFEMQMKSLEVHAKSFALSIGQPLIGPIGTFVNGLVEGAKAINQWVDLSGGVLGFLASMQNGADWASTAIDLFRGKVESPIDLSSLDAAAKKLKEVKDAAFDAANSPDALVAKWKKGAADMAITVPTAADALKLLDHETKQLEEDTNKSIAAMKPFNDAMRELNSVGMNYYDTMEQIDGATVEAIKYYLAAGVSQSTLANAYALTAEQVKAVAGALKEETEAHKALQTVEQNRVTTSLESIGVKSNAELDYVKKWVAGNEQITKLEKDHADFVMKQTMTESDYKKAKIDEWIETSIKSFGLTGEALDRYTAAVRQAGADQKLALSEPLTEAERHMKDLEKAAVTSFAVIGKGANEKADVEKGAAKTTADMIAGEYERQTAAFEQFKGVVVAGTGSMIVTSEALRNIMNTNMQSLSDYIERDYQMQQAQRDRGEFFVPGMSTNPQPGLTGWRASGGPVSAGGTYMVGERGPELFRPASSGAIFPNGAGVTVQNTIYVNGSVKDIAPQLIQELTRLMKQTRQWPAA